MKAIVEKYVTQEDYNDYVFSGNPVTLISELEAERDRYALEFAEWAIDHGYVIGWGDWFESNGNGIDPVTLMEKFKQCQPPKKT